MRSTASRQCHRIKTGEGTKRSFEGALLHPPRRIPQHAGNGKQVYCCIEWGVALCRGTKSERQVASGGTLVAIFLNPTFFHFKQ